MSEPIEQGRPVPDHASGGGLNVKPSYVYRQDPDETAGRAIYRAKADAIARAQLAYERHKARLKRDDEA